MARPAIHPGEILADELLELGVTATELARQVKVDADHITQIVKGKRGITSETALRLGRCFGTSPLFWLNLQSAHDLQMATKSSSPHTHGH